MDWGRILTDSGSSLSELGYDSYMRGTMPKARRTTHRSTTGRKLYAVRDAKGRFKDIQTYERAHRADLMRKSKLEK